MYIESAVSDWLKIHKIIGAIPRQNAPLQAKATQHIAGTSSFGMSGINAHMLLRKDLGDIDMVISVVVSSL